MCSIKKKSRKSFNAALIRLSARHVLQCGSDPMGEINWRRWRGTLFRHGVVTLVRDVSCLCERVRVRVRDWGGEQRRPAERRGLFPAPLGHVAQGEAARAGWDSRPPSCVCWFHGLTPSPVSSVRQRVCTHGCCVFLPHRAGRETRACLLVSDAPLLSYSRLSCFNSPQLTWSLNIWLILWEEIVRSRCAKQKKEEEEKKTHFGGDVGGLEKQPSAVLNAQVRMISLLYKNAICW